MFEFVLDGETYTVTKKEEKKSTDDQEQIENNEYQGGQ